MKKIEHIGIAVRSLEVSDKVFAKIFNKEPYKKEVVESEGVSTSFFMTGENKIELLEATNPDSPIAKFIEKKGEGIHHIAFDVDDIVARYSLGQNNDGDALQAIAQSVIASHPGQVSELKSGNMKLLGFLVGQCMKASSGSGNPKLFSEILQKELML